MQLWRGGQCFQELVKPAVFCAAPTQSFSQVSLCTPFPSVGWLKGHIFQAPITLPLSQKILSGSFCQHCHHWLHSQPILTWSWECCSTCILEVPANQLQCLGAWGIKTRKLHLVDAKLFQWRLFEKFPWNKGTKILDGDLIFGSTEAGFVQIPCPEMLLVAFSSMLVPLKVKFWAYASFCEKQKWADQVPSSSVSFLAEWQVPPAK